MIMANGNNITPHSDAKIPLSPALSRSVHHEFLFDSLKTGSFMSIGQLCDDDYIAIFKKYSVKILKSNTIIIIGKQNVNGLWEIPLTPTPSPTPNVTKRKIYTDTTISNGQTPS